MNKEPQERVSVVIPTLNAEKHIMFLIKALKEQSRRPDEILIVDSCSEDRTREIAEAAGAHVICVNQSDFDHGGTRDMAFRRTIGDIVLFMTQDALPVDRRLIEYLAVPFMDNSVAVVGGRQTAYPDARPFERLIRAYNYPDIERIWGAEDIKQLGVRAFLISDVCAAYRRESYLMVGGFDHPVMTNEDMLIAERFLHAGYKLAYSGKAVVYHSHHLTLMQEYRRNYIVGRTMKRYEERFEHVGTMRTGVKLAKDVLWELLREGQFIEGLRFMVNCAVRFAGNRVGRYTEEWSRYERM